MGLLNRFLGGKKVATKIEGIPANGSDLGPDMRQFLENDQMFMQNFFDNERLRLIEKRLEIENRKKNLIERLSSS